MPCAQLIVGVCPLKLSTVVLSLLLSSEDFVVLGSGIMDDAEFDLPAAVLRRVSVCVCTYIRMYMCIRTYV